MGKKKRVDHSAAGTEAPNNPFGALASLRDSLPEGDAPDDTASGDDDGQRAPKRAPRAIVRRERKGHGGKTVTLVERATLTDDELRALKKELGVGARREGDTVVVQGDVVDRVQAWFASRVTGEPR
jgi:translation initiation factor 1